MHRPPGYLVRFLYVRNTTRRRSVLHPTKSYFLWDKCLVLLDLLFALIGHFPVSLDSPVSSTLWKLAVLKCVIEYPLVPYGSMPICRNYCE